jgi:hypothetical protein
VLLNESERNIIVSSKNNIVHTIKQGEIARIKYPSDMKLLIQTENDFFCYSLNNFPPESFIDIKKSRCYLALRPDHHLYLLRITEYGIIALPSSQPQGYPVPPRIAQKE